MPDNPSTFALNLNDVKKHETAVLMSKHRDYGPKNISNSPGGPMMGLAVRLHDKMARLIHLLEGPDGTVPENESLTDTLLDIANYATIGQMVLAGTWPGTVAGAMTSHPSVVLTQNTRAATRVPLFGDGEDL